MPRPRRPRRQAVAVDPVAADLTQAAVFASTPVHAKLRIVMSTLGVDGDSWCQRFEVGASGSLDALLCALPGYSPRTRGDFILLEKGYFDSKANRLVFEYWIFSAAALQALQPALGPKGAFQMDPRIQLPHPCQYILRGVRQSYDFVVAGIPSWMSGHMLLQFVQEATRQFDASAVVTAGALSGTTGVIPRRNRRSLTITTVDLLEVRMTIRATYGTEVATLVLRSPFPELTIDDLTCEVDLGGAHWAGPRRQGGGRPRPQGNRAGGRSRDSPAVGRGGQGGRGGRGGHGAGSRSSGPAVPPPASPGTTPAGVLSSVSGAEAPTPTAGVALGGSAVDIAALALSPASGGSRGPTSVQFTSATTAHQVAALAREAAARASLADRVAAEQLAGLLTRAAERNSFMAKAVASAVTGAARAAAAAGAPEERVCRTGPVIIEEIPDESRGFQLVVHAPSRGPRRGAAPSAVAAAAAAAATATAAAGIQADANPFAALVDNDMDSEVDAGDFDDGSDNESTDGGPQGPSRRSRQRQRRKANQRARQEEKAAHADAAAAGRHAAKRAASPDGSDAEDTGPSALIIRRPGASGAPVPGGSPPAAVVPTHGDRKRQRTSEAAAMDAEAPVEPEPARADSVGCSTGESDDEIMPGADDGSGPAPEPALGAPPSS